MEATQLSRQAFERLTAELEDLATRGRIDVAAKIERARELGDLSENGDYHAAKDEQGHMEGRIRQLEALLESAEIIEKPEPGVVGADEPLAEWERDLLEGTDKKDDEQPVSAGAE